MTKKIKLMLVAGEVSGDSHTTELIKKMREAAPETEFEFFGLTGEKMREANVETIVRADDLAIIGLLEITKALPKFYKVFRQLKRAAIDKKPDAVILTDFPDFNLPLAAALKKLGFKIIYYVSPQLWAWRSYRVRNVRRDIDLLLAILPFEKKWYSERNVSHVEYIGHPLAGEVRADLTKTEFCVKHKLNAAAPIVALLPGSRAKEVTRILPPMLEAAAILRAENPQTQFLIALAATRKRSDVERIIADARQKGFDLPENILILKDETREILNASDVAAVASGTATLETAFIGTPLVICYKVSMFNWNTLRHLINVPHYGLVNLIAEKRLATELIQNDLTGEKLARELKKLLEPLANKDMRRELKQTVEKLGAGGASQIAAVKILDFISTLKVES